ncbi:MAG TPA: alpha-L-fucosidase [Chitinophagaceae bacterium]|nr:alpha-L-fucosidase [Chitinophagaceae bacterium]
MRFFLFIFFFVSLSGSAQITKVHDPVPSKAQLIWQDMEFYLFAHFGPNTFTDKEWGEGTEQEDIFNPTNLDCRQWCRIAKAAGAKGIIITAKHHDGFCLWPSKYSTHTVRESKWKNGKGDVLKELSQACKEYGLKFGVYISPWDRNHPKYGTPAYNDVFVNMMKEIFANYGPIWELWWDGANGEGPNGKKQVYDWRRFENTVRKLSPNTVIFSDIGPDIRWCGNENGIVGETNWNYLDTAGFTRGIGAPPTDTLNQGNRNGKNWIPAECDVSIRPGWFYHKEQDGQVKSPGELFQLYLKSVGRGANLLLNVPPDRRGMISENDSVALMGFKKIREESFKNDLVKDATVSYMFGDLFRTTSFVGDRKFIELTENAPSPVKVSFKKAQKINCIILEEPMESKQRIKNLEISLLNNNKIFKKIEITTVGRKRIVTFPGAEVNEISIQVTQTKSSPMLSKISVFQIHENLIEK